MFGKFSAYWQGVGGQTGSSSIENDLRQVGHGAVTDPSLRWMLVASVMHLEQ